MTPIVQSTKNAKQSESMVPEVRIGLSLGSNYWQGAQRVLGATNVLFLEVDAVTWVTLWENSPSYFSLIMCVLFCILYMFTSAKPSSKVLV